jgi:hypothetical protein
LIGADSKPARSVSEGLPRLRCGLVKKAPCREFRIKRAFYSFVFKEAWYNSPSSADACRLAVTEANMQFQFDIASTAKAPPSAPPMRITPESVPDLLWQILELQRDQFGQMLDLQREQLNHAKATAQDNLARWRNLLTRWAEQYPQFAEQCKLAYPIMERCYVQMLGTMVEELSQQGEDALDSEFAVQEFLDRYGMKIGQLSHLLGIVGPLSEAALQNEAAARQQQQTPPQT